MISRFIKYVFVAILSFRRPLAALKVKYVSLDNQWKLPHGPFMATLERCDRNCEIDEYLKYYAYIKNVIKDSTITCDWIKETPVSFYKSTKFKMDYFFSHYFIGNHKPYIFFLIIIAINCYYINHRLKQKTY